MYSTIGQELAYAILHGRRAISGFSHQVAALLCVKRLCGRHLECVTSNQKSDSVSRCIEEQYLPVFIPILRFITAEP